MTVATRSSNELGLEAAIESCRRNRRLRLAELVRRVAAIASRRPPRTATPTWLLRGASPVGRLTGQNIAELVSASAGVTYWATDAKARRELGYAPRDLESGLTVTFGQMERG